METVAVGEFFKGGVLGTIPLIFLLATIIIGFDIIWRVEKKLDVFMKLLTLGVAFFGASKLIEVMGSDSVEIWENAMMYLDLAAGFFILLAFIEMYRIVRELNNEKE